jgi:hypothetical protein
MNLDGMQMTHSPTCWRDPRHHECAVARMTTLEELLAKALPLVEMEAESETYGGAHVEDPRDFKPDPECSTEAERATWQKAVDAAKAGQPFKMPKHRWESYVKREDADKAAKKAVAEGADTASVNLGKDGWFHVHIADNGWGLGVSTWREPALIELRDAIRAALGQPATGEGQGGERSAAR